jgi:hypothetical protein
MELLIPGLAIVALMVWASTRIKRNAAAAYDAETIETDDFVIQKPEGFLHNLNGDPANALEIYSREYGEAATGIRAGRVSVKINAGRVEDVASSIKDKETVVDDFGEVIAGKRYRLIETTRFEKESECSVTYKIAEKDGLVYTLEATRLAEASDEFKSKVDGFVASFELK